MGRTHRWNAEAVKAARKRSRLRQEDLAAAIGVERKAVVRWEAGGEPTVTNAAGIARTLGVPLDSLVSPLIDEKRATPEAPETELGAEAA